MNDTTQRHAIRDDVTIYHGARPHKLGQKPLPTDPTVWSDVPPAPGHKDWKLVPEGAVALGGLAGNNAHGTGYLEAIRRQGLKPQIIACTSGQLRSVEAYLRGDDLSVWFKQRLAAYQPCGNNTDLNMLHKMVWGLADPIRLSLFEFPGDLAATLGRLWSHALLGPRPFSFFRELAALWPARSLVTSDTRADHQRMADAFLAEKDTGILFNAYDYENKQEVVYMNAAAFHLTGKSVRPSKKRPWVRYAEISADGVEDALRLYEYGFTQGSAMLDGAYRRDLMLREIPGDTNKIERITVVRPQPGTWLNGPPLSWTELRDLQTQVMFDGVYAGERECIRLMNSVLKPIHIRELPLDLARSYWDYALEDIRVFNSAFWRANQIAPALV